MAADSAQGSGSAPASESGPSGDNGLQRLVFVSPDATPISLTVQFIGTDGVVEVFDSRETAGPLLASLTATTWRSLSDRDGAVTVTSTAGLWI